MECSNRNSFCFLCAMFLPVTRRKNITEKHRGNYKIHFNIVCNDKVLYAPEFLCITCACNLSGGPKTYLKYLVPTEWLEQEDGHNEDWCYFCVNIPLTVGITYKNRAGINYYLYELSMNPPVVRPDEERIKKKRIRVERYLELNCFKNSKLSCRISRHFLPPA